MRLGAEGVRSRAAADERDDGFSLVEALVSMVIFAVLATVAVALLIQTVGVSKIGTRRVTAANLANQALEVARSQRALDIPLVTPPTQVPIDGTTYTVTQTGRYAALGDQNSICTSSSNNISSLLVSVSVTWPNMGNVKPVTADTSRALGIGVDGLNNATGVAAISLVDGSGNPVSGVAVTLSPGSQSLTTGADGCAVFVSLAPKTYTASVSQPGFVGVDGSQAVTSSPIGVTAGLVSRYSISYAQPGSLNIPYAIPARTIVSTANPLPFMVNSSRFQPVQSRAFPYCASSSSGCVSPGSSSVTAASLFPGVFTAWAGTCADAVPTANTSGATVVSNQSATASPVVSLSGVVVTVTSTSHQPIVIQSITATHASDSTSCSAGESYTLTNPANGTGPALPPGMWTVTVTGTVGGSPGSVTSGVLTMRAGAATPYPVSAP